MIIVARKNEVRVRISLSERNFSHINMVASLEQKKRIRSSDFFDKDVTCTSLVARFNLVNA
jgi:hypothetical protein